jgi:hypothetical protein
MSFSNDQPWLAAKRAQNFMRAVDRPACRNCTQAQAYAREDSNASNYKCLLGSFMTTAMAVCERHELQTAQAAPRRAGG